MKKRILKSEHDYKEAINRLESIGDNPKFADDKDLIDEFELLDKLISDYENSKFHIEEGNPIEIIKLKMNYMDLKQKDLIGVISSSKGIVSEVMNKKRGLSKAMIRNLSKLLSINQDILNTEYEIQKDDSTISEKGVSSNLFKFLRPRGIDPTDIQRRVAKRGTIVQLCA
ncbi:HTH-type transcriptional regulator/antitoxin HigA [Winogradskyella eximia]|uniref:HTH-type transcriptional regulator/antitoxin HigA n=1 Tax=Winogradskyella eximia TaxID=262006 RepID=A0A3D9H711_9FLAO|nr:transcriptional regulator [Winogradskyella eximia]RED45278.1 HTH-type transcriptional regulator/antitoxin HigA [Winogradskyella eximia]